MKTPSKGQNEKLSAQAKKATERAAKPKPPTSPEWEETVALIRQLHRDGLTPKAIIDRLNQSDRRTRKGMKFTQRNQLVRYWAD